MAAVKGMLVCESIEDAYIKTIYFPARGNFFMSEISAWRLTCTLLALYQEEYYAQKYSMLSSGG